MVTASGGFRMDAESLITLGASILLANQQPTPDAEAQSGRIRTAVDTAKQVHTEVKRVLAADAAQVEQIARKRETRQG
jgi:hypothetical protein